MEGYFDFDADLHERVPGSPMAATFAERFTPYLVKSGCAARPIVMGHACTIGDICSRRRHYCVGIAPARMAIDGRISKIGDAWVRAVLYEAANIILTKPLKGCTALKSR
jgi:hypothetical protein